MDFSMNCKSFPQLAYYEIQPFKLKDQKVNMLFPKIQIQLFRGANHLQKWLALHPSFMDLIPKNFHVRVA